MINNSTDSLNPVAVSLEQLELIQQFRSCLLMAQNSHNCPRLVGKSLWVIYKEISEILDSQLLTLQRMPVQPPESVNNTWDYQAPYQQSMIRQPVGMLQPVFSHEDSRNNQRTTDLHQNQHNRLDSILPMKPKRIHFVSLLANTALEKDFTKALRKSSGAEFEYTIGKKIEHGVPTIMLCENVTRWLEDTSLELFKEAAKEAKLLLFLANCSLKLPQKDGTLMVKDKFFKTTYIAFRIEDSVHNFINMDDLRNICHDYLGEIRFN